MPVKNQVNAAEEKDAKKILDASKKETEEIDASKNLNTLNVMVVKS